jgi:Holliday junction resolvasome RuvABC endonuclease subunit
MIVIGIDYSIVSPAICSVDTKTNEHKFFAFKQRKRDESFYKNFILLDYPKWKSDEERYSKLATTLLDAVIKHAGEPSRAFFEAYSYGGNGAVFNLAEATGCMKQLLYSKGIRINVFPPSVVKKHATGKGNAKKREMMTAFKLFYDPYKWLDVLDKGDEKIIAPLSDVVDAFSVLECGMKISGQ